MSLLTLSSVSLAYGADTLLEGVSFSVAPGEGWGVVGRNGTGKTSLFRIMAGLQEPTSGTVSLRPGATVALLDQYRDFGAARTVWEAAASGYRELLELEAVLARESKRLEELGSRVREEDLARFGREQERFEHLGGYDFRARVDAILQGLGFDAQEARARPLDLLSGGERGRVGLAGQLAAPSDLLLLDEPTNHLDLETIEWLKGHLREGGRTVMVISHDRAFLDDWADHVLHLAEGTAQAYRGGYSAFVRQRDEARLALLRKVDAQRKEVAREEAFIRKHISGQKTAQAQSRRKKLARLPRLSPPPDEEDAMALRFDALERGGDQVVVLEHLSVSVPGRTLLAGFSSVVRRGDVIAVVGPNGSGKTTLLATLLGDREPTRGQARLGAGITPGWFRQDHAHLPAEKSLFDCVADARPQWNRGKVQGHLGRFGFSGDAVLRRTDSLSGGERARVALALITLQGANLLALDEPTNHLDVESIEALEDALDAFPGTVLLVSHDRALLRELATRIWALEEGGVVDYPGPFVDWERKAAERAADRAAGARERDRRERGVLKDERKRVAEARKVDQAARRALRRGVERAETEVQELEKEVLSLEGALADPSLHQGGAEGAREAGRLNGLLRQTRARLDEAMDRWERAVEADEEMR